MTITLAVDCMGGDHGPSVVVPAVLEFLRHDTDCAVILVGREDVLRPLLTGADASLDGRWRIQHASEVVDMHDPVATALPTLSGHSYVLDLGANVDCAPEHLLQFGIMGAMLAAALDHKERPTVGLLNIGEEEIKGNETVKRAGELLKESGLNFIGNVEGDGIYTGAADVIVCDGFVGNVALKTSEGLARMISAFLREEFSRNLLTRLAGLAALPVLKSFKKRVDPRRYNGASLLGLKGVVVKSHGSADSFAFRHALEQAAEAARQNLPEKIAARMSRVVPLGALCD